MYYLYHGRSVGQYYYDNMQIRVYSFRDGRQILGGNRIIDWKTILKSFQILPDQTRPINAFASKELSLPPSHLTDIRALKVLTAENILSWIPAEKKEEDKCLIFWHQPGHSCWFYWDTDEALKGWCWFLNSSCELCEIQSNNVVENKVGLFII